MAGDCSFSEPHILDLRFVDSELIFVGSSHGNLIKYILESDGAKYHIKTGRKSSRDNPNLFGIEPLVEQVCYEFSKLLELPCAKEELCLAKIRLYEEDIVTIVNKSEDFAKGFNGEITLNEILALNIVESPKVENVIGKLNQKDLILKLLLFDFLILNEDRHNGNISWLVDNDGNLVFSPVFDNGYSLLYDDVKGMISGYKTAIKLANCNSDFYGGSFHNMEVLILNNREDLLSLLDKLHAGDPENILDKVQESYRRLSPYVNRTVLVPELWFRRVSEFLKWRISYVRNLCLDVE